jgi:deoxyribose-phosphate aldolase
METTKILNLAPYIDHTLLKPDATKDQIIKLCDEALKYSFKGVCVNSRFVELAHSKLKKSSVLVISVIGFPLGACLSEVKRHEAILATKAGANEIDMVINIGAIKERDWSLVESDIRAVTEGVPVPVKVILETGLLTHEEIVQACKVSELGGARFVKTCTGFATGSATVEHIALMRSLVSERVEVKASGGIKTYEQARALIAAGATRLGTSSGVQLMTGQTVSPQSY